VTSSTEITAFHRTVSPATILSEGRGIPDSGTCGGADEPVCGVGRVAASWIVETAGIAACRRNVSRSRHGDIDRRSARKIDMRSIATSFFMNGVVLGETD
jgi:hypothetical protein